MALRPMSSLCITSHTSSSAGSVADVCGQLRGCLDRRLLASRAAKYNERVNADYVNGAVGGVLIGLAATLLLLTRATPQLNLFSIGFPLRVLVGLIALVLFLPQMIELMTQMLGQARGVVAELFR